eukprot:11223190-Lingulodinium_polyedra.AAC.1
MGAAGGTGAIEPPVGGAVEGVGAAGALGTVVSVGAVFAVESPGICRSCASHVSRGALEGCASRGTFWD